MKWTDAIEIAEALDEIYSDVDIVNLRYKDFRDWIINLDDFDDDPEKSNERILENIHLKWLEIRDVN